MRNRFDEQLHQLNEELLGMGALVEEAIENASRALVQKKEDCARRAIVCEREIDRKERDIETLCLKLLLQQQPVARDLRLVSAALKMITDMERIGDQAADIAGIVLYLIDQPYVKPLEHLPQMAQNTIKMVTGSIDAFVRKDLEKAEEVIGMDDEVDRLFRVIREELIALIHRNPDSGEQAIDMMMIAKYFERIGDHAQNIAEWVVFSITGQHKEEDSE
ncbi:MAG: phosphate signaling complex protein PhoU [Pyramidobacter sp.]|nr:phosphate signaling complex protein PhoU [Pyramidobacter sp.]